MSVTNTVAPQITTTFTMDKIKSPKKFDLENGSYSPITQLEGQKQLEELRPENLHNFVLSHILRRSEYSS